MTWSEFIGVIVGTFIGGWLMNGKRYAFYRWFPSMYPKK